MSNVAKTRTRDVTLVDQIRHNPVDDSNRRSRRKVILWLLFFVIAIVVVQLVWRFNADRPVEYADDLEHFKYGSIGSEPGGSLANAVGGLLPPFEIFKVLPQICDDKLPGGYASLGMIFEEGHEMPVGVSRRYRLGFDQVGLNCASCHAGTLREAPGAETRVIAGMPSHQLYLQDFFRFVLDCTLDSRFTADNVLGRIEQSGTDLSWFDRLLFRYAVIPRTREQTLQLSTSLALIMGDNVTAWGPGRVDTFNPYKGMQFNWQLERLPLKELTGASDFPALWNQAPREGMELHWDGNNTSLAERNLSASLGAGVTPVTIDHERLERVAEWALTLPPPEYPFSIDTELAQRGQAPYATYCQDCHADHRFRDGISTGTKVGTVEPIDKVGTDPYRLNSYTYEFASNQYTLYPDSKYQLNKFRKTNGYANQPLDGVWARAPYLHNGSVPTLRDLLNAPEDRPVKFYRGYDVFDQDRVGFVHDVGMENGTEYWEFDTTLPGNSNSGHVYGVYLSDEEKDAIVEYLKRF